MARITFNLTATCCLRTLRYPECGVYCNFKPKIRTAFEEMLVMKQNNVRPHFGSILSHKNIILLCLSNLHQHWLSTLIYLTFSHALSLSPQGPLLHRPSVRLLHVHGHDSRDDTRSRRVNASRTKHRKKGQKHTFFCRLLMPSSVHAGTDFVRLGSGAASLSRSVQLCLAADQPQSCSTAPETLCVMQLCDTVPFDGVSKHLHVF